MITIDYESLPPVYYGLSTDTKPTEDVENATWFVEIDTSKIYSFDAESLTWNEWGA